MGGYIEGPPHPDGSTVKPREQLINHPKRSVFAFPILSALLRDFQAMSESSPSSSKTGRPRGRRAAPKVPCDDCIARASSRKEEGGVLELCERCTAALNRPRRKQQEEPNVKRVRRQSNAIIDTAL